MKKGYHKHSKKKTTFCRTLAHMRSRAVTVSACLWNHFVQSSVSRHPPTRYNQNQPTAHRRASLPTHTHTHTQIHHFMNPTSQSVSTLKEKLMKSSLPLCLVDPSLRPKPDISVFTTVSTLLLLHLTLSPRPRPRPVGGFALIYLCLQSSCFEFDTCLPTSADRSP